MNILPFVCALLVIFGLLSTSLFRERITLSNLQSSCLGSIRAERASRNYLESSKYNHLFKKASSKKTKETKPPTLQPPPPKKEIEAPTHRDDKIFTTSTKVNLSPLFTEKNPLLYETAIRYLHSLYKTASFYGEGLEKQLLDQIIAKGSAQKQCASFAELFPDDPILRAAFYKMLKGTGSYDLETGIGYPPLDHYFQLEPETKAKPISLHYAPTRLLRSLFGDPLTDAIIKEEAQSGSRISKDKLQELLLKNNLNPQTFDPVISYSTVKTELQLVSISDRESGITVQTWEKVKCKKR